MSLDAMAWAKRQRTGSPTRKAVLYFLADRHNGDTGRCDPRIATLAADAELGERTVQRALAELVQMGLLRRERKRRKDGSLGGYVYSFPLDQVSPAASPPAAAAGRPPAAAAGQEPEVPEPSTSTTDVVAVPAGAPKEHRIDGQSLPMNALTRACGIGAGSLRMGEAAAALNGTHGKPGIRQLAWAEIVERGGRLAGDVAIETAIADLIRERAAEYERVMDGAMLTPTALLKWWVDLPTLKGRRGRAPDAMAGARAAADELRRMK